MSSQSPEKDDVAEVGRCALCHQEMIATRDDCWHPFTVPKACPPEPPDARMRTKESYDAWQAFYASGLRPGRPGRQHFEPMPEEAWSVTGTSEPMAAPYWLGYIFTLDEARADGRDPRVSEDGKHCFGMRFSAHRVTVYRPGQTNG